jgi:hypothetical protein
MNISYFIENILNNILDILTEEQLQNYICNQYKLGSISFTIYSSLSLFNQILYFQSNTQNFTQHFKLDYINYIKYFFNIYIEKLRYTFYYYEKVNIIFPLIFSLLDDGYITLDRVVSQGVPSRSAVTQLFVGAFVGPNNVVQTIPSMFSHPGYRPLATEIGPEGKGRPYSMDYIRSTYGIVKSSRYRNVRTWPFFSSHVLGDRSEKDTLNKIVAGITDVHIKDFENAEAEQIKSIETEVKTVSPDKIGATAKNSKQESQEGGLFGLFEKEKGIYTKATVSRIPNFVSVKGSIYAAAFAHAEYLGMFFFGAFRLPGMKNPTAGNDVAVFTLHSDGVKIHYTPFKAVVQSIPEQDPTESTTLVNKTVKSRRHNRNTRNTRNTRRRV